MPDDVQESTPVDQEPVELAAPEVSEVDAGAKPTSATPIGFSEERLQELLEAQRIALLEDFDRKLQSQKDRRIGKLETKVDEMLATKAAVEAAGGWDQVIDRQRQAEDLETRLNTILDARLSQAPASQPDKWQAEWDSESRKILDAAGKLGIALSTEEYNAALFGKKFVTKGDAYAALNQALLRKGRGEAIPVAAIATEGGEVARVPEPAAPKPIRQKFDDALKAGKQDEARKILDEQWANIERQDKLAAARRAAAAAGVELKV